MSNQKGCTKGEQKKAKIRQQSVSFKIGGADESGYRYEFLNRCMGIFGRGLQVQTPNLNECFTLIIA